MELLIVCPACKGSGNCDYAATGHIHSAEDEGDCPRCLGARVVRLTPENCPRHEWSVDTVQQPNGYWAVDPPKPRLIYCRYCDLTQAEVTHA